MPQNPQYTLQVSAYDGFVSTTHDTIIINVTDVDEPRAAPGAPAVAVASRTSVAVSWTAPDMSGKPSVTDYDVRYFEGGADPATEADWILPGEALGYDHVGTGTSGTIPGLDTGSAYRVQVRAANAEGTGVWSASGAATRWRTRWTRPPTRCSTSPRRAAPDTAGKPPVTDYDVQYRASGASVWTDANFDGTGTRATIAGLSESTAYDAQVRATNVEGTSDWSATYGWSSAGDRFFSPLDREIMGDPGATSLFISHANYERGMARMGRFSVATMDGIDPRIASGSVALTGGVDAFGGWYLHTGERSPKPLREASVREYSAVVYDETGIALLDHPLRILPLSSGPGGVWALRVPATVASARALRIWGRGGDLLLDAELVVE